MEQTSTNPTNSTNPTKKHFHEYFIDAYLLIYESKVFRAFNFILVLIALIATLLSVLSICWVTLATLLGVAGYTWDRLIPPSVVIVILDAVLPILYIFGIFIAQVIVALYLRKKDEDKNKPTDQPTDKPTSNQPTDKPAEASSTTEDKPADDQKAEGTQA